MKVAAWPNAMKHFCFYGTFQLHIAPDKSDEWHASLSTYRGRIRHPHNQKSRTLCQILVRSQMPRSKSNITLIGESHAGKTTIAMSLVQKPTCDEYRPTVGAAMVRVPFKFGDSVNVFYVWDTAGMEQYHSLAPVFYQNSDAALLVYDVSDRHSFERAEMWHQMYQEQTLDASPVLVVANKIDLVDQLVVPIDEGKDWARRHNCEFIEVSAKTMVNITSILVKLADMLLGRGSARAGDRTDLQMNQPPSEKCC
jgi:small GTP-binding protein